MGLIAEWNRTDLTQLVSAGAVDFNDAGGAPTLSVVAVPERGNVLRYLPGGSAGVHTQVFMWSIASGMVIPSFSERRDVDIEIELYDATFGGTNSSMGIFILGDLDTPLHGFCHCATGGSGGTEREAVLNNGTVQTAGANGTAVSERLALYRVRGRKPVGAAPEVSSFAEGWTTAGGTSGEPRRSGTTATARGSVQAFGSGAALGVTWDGISANRIGIAFRGSSPATQIDILNFRVVDSLTPGSAVVLHQRIYDTGVGGYVYYSKGEIDTAPLSTETEPNHTNNLVTATHGVL